MHVFARAPFRYLGVDYPYGNFDVPNDTLAAAMVTAGYVTDTSIPGSGGGTINLSGSQVTGQLPFDKLALTGTPNGSQFVRDDGTLATPTGTGTVTNTGTLTQNGLVLGNNGSDTKVSAALRSDGAGKLTAGLAGTTAGALALENATSGSIVLAPPTGALGTRTLTLPAATDTLVGRGTTDTLTGKTIDGANNTLTVRLDQNDVTGKLPLAKLNTSGTADNTTVLWGDGVFRTLSQSYTQTMLNTSVANATGASFAYPGGPGASTVTVSCATWSGAIVVIERSTDAGSTWNPLSGDFASFSANTVSTLTETTGVLLRFRIIGTPGATVTATLSR